MPLFVFHGPDHFRAREEVREMRARLDRDGNLAHNTSRLEGRGLSPADLRSACHTASFFAEDRLVIVEGMQARLSGTRRRRSTSSSSRSRSPTSAAASDFDQFVDVLTNLPPTTTVVLLDEQPPNALIEALGSAATVRQFPILRREELRAWTAARAKSQGAALAPQALERLVTLVDGFHLGELAQEIDKLVTYANGRTITVEDIDTMVSASVQLQVWDLTDAVIEGRGERALSVLRSMDARDQPPQLLTFMLVRQYRQLILAQALQREGLSADQIGSRLGIVGFPLRKAIDQSSRYAVERLEAAYRLLLASDVAVKTGVLDADVALEMLVVELAELGRQRTPSRGTSRTAQASGGGWSGWR